MNRIISVFRQRIIREINAGVHVKAVLTLLNTAFLPISRSVTFQATLNLCAYFIKPLLFGGFV